MKIPGRLHHETPGWVPNGAAFHLRLRAAASTRLIDASGEKPRAILDAARHYHQAQTWFCRMIVLMPDHLHTIVVFPPERDMSATVRAWKSFLKRKHDVSWQEGYFDHRFRSRKETDECWHYIRNNPVRAGLAETAEDWPWLWTSDNGIAPE